MPTHLAHQKDTDLSLKKQWPKGDITDSAGNVIGHNVEIKVVTTTMGPPNQHAVLPLIYGKAFPKVRDYANISLDLSIANQAFPIHLFIY